MFSESHVPHFNVNGGDGTYLYLLSHQGICIPARLRREPVTSTGSVWRKPGSPAGAVGWAVGVIIVFISWISQMAWGSLWARAWQPWGRIPKIFLVVWFYKFSSVSYLKCFFFIVVTFFWGGIGMGVEGRGQPVQQTTHCAGSTDLQTVPPHQQLWVFVGETQEPVLLLFLIYSFTYLKDREI